MFTIKVERMGAPCRHPLTPRFPLRARSVSDGTGNGGSEGKARGEGVSAWRAYSLNFDREHAGDKGEPWRRMFMSDLATGFAVLALVGSD